MKALNFVLIAFALTLAGCSDGFQTHGVNLKGVKDDNTFNPPPGTWTGGGTSGGTGTSTGTGTGNGTGGTGIVFEPANLAQATIVNSPADVNNWPQTTKITHMELRGDGIALTFDKQDGAGRWPDIYIPGWDGGNLQYTLWLMMRVNGHWYASGIIQFWYGLSAGGGDVTQNNQIAINWVYDGRWGAMQSHQPVVGEPVGFMVTSGNQRGVLDASQAGPRERSQVVTIPFPASSGAAYNF